MKNLKQAICVALSTVLLFSVMGVAAFATNASDFVVQDGVLTAYNGTDTVVNIPANLGITKINDSLFANNKTITSVSIPNGVTSIGDSAFMGCSGLTAITIPKGVTEIKDSTFSGCSGLASITIPTGVTTIGFGAFSGCTDLTSIVIPDGVTSISGAVFADCSGLTSITIPSSVTFIGGNAFLHCSSLTSIKLPSGLTSIESGMFDSCTKLTSLTIPDGVTSIGDSAFTECSGLTAITIPKGVTEIEDSTFSGCSGLTSITIPESIMFIDDAAFWGCSGLTSITIPSNVTSFGVSVFKNCSNDFQIYGATGSYAEHYAKINDIAFVAAKTMPAATITAEPTSVKVQLNGSTTSIPAYTIGKFDYFKLRDIAVLLNGSAKQFDMIWDGATKSVKLTSGKTYTAVGSELSSSDSTNITSAIPSESAIYIDGIMKTNFTLYNINGNSYVKISDIANSLNFKITWDSASSTICIDPTVENSGFDII